MRSARTLLPDMVTIWVCRAAFAATRTSWSSSGERLLADALELPEVLDLLGRRLLGGQPGGFRFEKAARGE